jgi:hypothetical protein
MLTPAQTRISTQYHQLKAGGDLARADGLVQGLIEADDAARAAARRRARARRRLHRRAHPGLRGVRRARCAQTPAGRDRGGIGPGARRPANRGRASSPMQGRDRHLRHGPDPAPQGRGERADAGPTCCCCAGTSASPAPASARCAATPTCRASAPSASPKSPSWRRSTSSRAVYGFEPPREKGLNTMEACEGVLAGGCKAFVGLGGNFVRAVPDTDRWSRPGAAAAHGARRDQAQPQPPGARRGVYLLPCLGRIEIDRQAGGEQTVTVEDSTGCMHASQRAWPSRRRTRCCPSRPSSPASPRRRCAQPESATGTLGGRLRAGARPIAQACPRSSTTSTRGCGAGRLPRPLAGQGAGVEDPDGQGQLQGLRQPAGRPRHARGRRRRAAPDHGAQRRPVQHHHLQPGRPLPRHLRHAARAADEPGRHGAAGRARGRHGRRRAPHRDTPMAPFDTRARCTACA